MPDWIYRSDDALRSQSAGFSDQINSDPSFFGTTPLAAAQLANLQAAFAESCFTTTQMTGNSSADIRLKSTRRAELVTAMRAMGTIIRALPHITPIDLQKLGMNVPQGRRSRVPSPIDTPRIDIGQPRARVVPLRVRSTLTPDTRGLPRDVKSIEVFIFAGDGQPPTDLYGWHQAGSFTKSNFDLNLNRPEIQSGQTVWIVARYVNAKAQHGLLSSPVYTHALGPAMRIHQGVIIPGRAA